MKNFLILFIFSCVVCMSCDSRKSRSESLKSSIEEFNEKQFDLEIINYYPNEYTEVITDTIISNRIKIHIKNYTLENKSVLISSDDKNNPKKVNHHRVFESDIIVSTASETLFKTHISASQFKIKLADEFWNNATLQHVWVNQELSTSENILLDMSFINPNEKSYKLYRMSIDANGQQKIKLIEKS